MTRPRYQSQLVVLAAQISWSEMVEKALQGIEQKGDGDSSPLTAVQGVMEATLNVLADSVLHEQPPVRRKKLEHLVSTHQWLHLEKLYSNNLTYFKILSMR